MSILSVESVYKGFGTKPLLEEVTFGLGRDERMGIIGANGSGKTTLLKIAAGVEPPDGGRVQVASGWQIGYLPRTPSSTRAHRARRRVRGGLRERPTPPRLRGRRLTPSRPTPPTRTLLARVTDLSHKLDVTGGWDLEVHARSVLDRLGLPDTDAVVGTLSGGQRKRVALARALILRPDLLILDEPTNHLDADTITWIEEYLARYAGALLLVTHDRYFLDRVTNTMLEVARGTVQRFEGNYTRYLEQKEAQEAVREAEAQKRESLARRELAWLRRGAKARTTKQKARVDRAEALLAAPKEGPEQQIELEAASARLGKKVIELENVSKGYDGEPLMKGFSHRFLRGERVGVIGPNGTGKTTLLELIARRTTADSGHVEIGPTVVIGYYDQESRALDDSLRIIDYIEEVAENVRTADGSIITASQMLDRFLFPPAVQRTPIALLSGGERRRLYLLRLLMGAPNVLLLDEPTNDLDIPTLVALEEYLETFPGCLVVVSHDRAFLDRTVEHVLRFDGEGEVRPYPGNYSAYLEARAREGAEAAARETARTRPVPAPAAPPPSAPPASRKLSYKERRELEELEERIAKTEGRQAELEAALVEAGADYEAVARLTADLQALAETLERDVERWAELAELA
jgi:ABC transport system ATP-binding/permease protein